MARSITPSISRRLFLIAGLILAVSGLTYVAAGILQAVRHQPIFGFLGVLWAGLGILLVVVSRRVPKSDAAIGAHSLTFTVGTSEIHRVEFEWDQFWGGVSIRVDGVVIRDEIRMLSVHLVKTWQFDVGENERHAVRIDKTRPLFAAAVRPQPLSACVDGALVAQSA
jgi:hypothetical protein